MALTTISPHDAQELIARGAKLIDIRDADEYLREHIPEADLAPLSVLDRSGPYTEANCSGAGRR